MMRKMTPDTMRMIRVRDASSSIHTMDRMNAGTMNPRLYAMSNSAKARPRKSSGIDCCVMVSAEILPRKNAKNPTNRSAAKPASETSAPNTSVPAPSSTMEEISRRMGGTRSFHFCASTSPSAPPTNPPPPVSASAIVLALPPCTRFFAYSANVKRTNPQNW
jgi:hypothetical protein